MNGTKKLILLIFNTSAIVILMLYALYLGHNGVMLSASVAIIAGLAGYNARIIKDTKKKE